MDILLILLITVVALTVTLGLVIRSVRRQGAVGTWLGRRLLRSERVQAVAMKRIEQQLADDPDALTDVADRAGVPEAQARAALAEYQRMSPAEQQRVIRRAEQMNDEPMPVSAEELAQITATSAPARRPGVPAQRDRNRAKAKAARQARKRNRR